MKDFRWVLVVEDEAELSEMMADALEAAGYKAVRAGTAAEAIHKVSRQRFQCIVLDMKLEHGSGEQVLAFIRDRKGDYNERTPALVVSGHLDRDLVGRIREQVHAFMVKPLKLGELVERVGQLIAAAEPARRSGRASA
jgi:DNA-binding response OmpR family regulator